MTAPATDAPRPRRLPIAPTTLALYQKCPRAWAHRKLDRRQPAYTKGKSIGHAAHAHVEEWYRTGVRPPEGEFAGRLAGVLIPHLPPRAAPGIRVEEYVTIDTGSPCWYYHGWIDLRSYGDVRDYKFYSRWAVTHFGHDAASLPRDPQTILYCAAARGGDGARFTMHYVVKPADPETGTPKHEPVAVQMDRATIAAGLAELDRIALQIIWWTASGASANQIPHTAESACQGVGLGCDFAEWCLVHEPGCITPPWQKAKSK